MDQEKATEALSTWGKAAANITDLVNKLAGPLAEEIGLTLGDKAREYRLRNAIRIFARTQDMLREAGLQPKSIPARLFLPMIESASLEDDETLQEHWAGLLANASSSTADTVLPSFIEVLKQLTPFEARALDRLFDAVTHLRTGLTRQRVSEIEPYFGPLGAKLGDGDWSVARAILGEKVGSQQLTNFGHSYEFRLLVTDLVRLGLLHPHDPGLTINKRAKSIDDVFKTGEREYYITPFAHAFVRACRPPRASDPKVQT